MAIARDNIPGLYRHVANRYSDTITKLLDESSPLIDHAISIDPHDLAYRDHSELFTKIREYKKTLDNALAEIKDSLRSYAGDPFNLMTPEVAARLDPLRLWEDTENKIISQAAIRKAIQEDIDAAAKGDIRYVFPSSEMIKSHYIEPVCDNVGLARESLDGIQRADSLLRYVRNNELEYLNSSYFHNLYFWPKSKWSEELKKDYEARLKSEILSAIIKRFDQDYFWLRRGDVNNIGEKIIGDRIKFAEGQKTESFMRHAMYNTGEILQSTYKFPIKNGMKKGLMPMLERRKVDRFVTYAAHKHFVEKFDTHRQLTEADIIDSCENNAAIQRKNKDVVDTIKPVPITVLIMLKDIRAVKVLENGVYERNF